MLEKLVHTGRTIPKHQVCVTFEYPDDLPVTTIDPNASLGWNAADYIVSRRVGDAWLLAAKTAILLVPSVVFDVDRNALINPAQAETTRIRVAGIKPIRWDDRLFLPHP